MTEEDWERTPEDVERDKTMSKTYELYARARLALTCRETLGHVPTAEIPDAPAWLKANLDESGMAILRAELVETFNKYKPAEGWEYPDGEICGDWRRLPQDPEKLIEWVDNDARSQIGEMAIGVLRDLRHRGPTTPTGREQE